MRICLLHGCNKPTASQHENAWGWRAKYCCKSHLSKTSAHSRHGTIPNIDESIEERKSRTLAYIHDYVIAKQKRTAQATPKWANRKAMKAIYDERRRLTKETGIIHEVDHIIPLSGKNVCGLHVETNLRILTRDENRAKYNHNEE